MNLPVKRFGPQQIGGMSAIAATLAGLINLSLAQAPVSMIVVNLAALCLGMLLLLGGRTLRSGGAFTPTLMLVMALLLLVTALFGEATEGARRWLMVGPMFIQSSLIVLPALILLFVGRRTMFTVLAMVIAALSLALQPDRAMAGALLAAMVTLSVVRFDRTLLIPLAASLAAFMVTVVRPDTVPAVPFVDQVYYSAFELHWLSGALVLGGTALLLLPAFAAAWSTGTGRDRCIVFGAIWLALILAAALGDYPTPVVGYSGAAILGYVLSIAVLPRKTCKQTTRELQADDGERSSREGEDMKRIPVME